MSDHRTDPLANSAAETGNRVCVKGIQDLSNLAFQLFPDRLSAYFEAEEKLFHYTQAVTMFGIRRTGKTVVLNQLWSKFKTDQSIYLYIEEQVNCSEIVDIVRERPIDYLFIDEVTRLEHFDIKIHTLLDMCAFRGTRLVMAGTDSFLITLAARDSAFGRLNLVKFLPLKFSDIKKIHGENTSFSDFCDHGLFLSKTNVVQDILTSVIGSVEKSFQYRESPLCGITQQEYMAALQTTIEYVIGSAANHIKPPAENVSWGLSGIDLTQVKENKTLNSLAAKEFYAISQCIDIVKVLPRITLDRESKSYPMFYLTLPALYISYYSSVAGTENVKDLQITSDVISGLVFEAAAVTNILSILDRLDISYKAYSIRGFTGEYEIDLCIELMDGVHTTSLTLIEFKRSQDKYSRHFNHPAIVDYCREYTKVNKYNVYEKQTKEIDHNHTRVGIEEFLENLTDYLR